MDEMLQRHEPPPDGVAAQLNFFLGGTERCGPDLGPLKEQVDVPETVIIPSAPKFCAYGFDPRFPVTMEVTSPTGMTRTRLLPHDANGEAATHFPIPPGSPDGRYFVDARQGTVHAIGTFVAWQTEHPTMAMSPLRVTPGTPIDVFFGGLPPDRGSDVHLYACDFTPSGTHSYVATHTVTTNAAGEAHLVLHTSPATPDNCYALQSQDIIYPNSHPPLRMSIPFAIRAARP
jgi:hypothetical protein